MKISAKFRMVVGYDKEEIVLCFCLPHVLSIYVDKMHEVASCRTMIVRREDKKWQTQNHFPKKNPAQPSVNAYLECLLPLLWEIRIWRGQSKRRPVSHQLRRLSIEHWLDHVSSDGPIPGRPCGCSCQCAFKISVKFGTITTIESSLVSSIEAISIDEIRMLGVPTLSLTNWIK